MDGLVQRIQEQVPPLEQWRKFIYCESMTGKAYGEVDHFAGGRLDWGDGWVDGWIASWLAGWLGKRCLGRCRCAPMPQRSCPEDLHRTASPRHPPLLPAGQTSAYQRQLSPEPIAHLSQHKLLPMLLDVAQRYPTARVLFGHRVNRWAAQAAAAGCCDALVSRLGVQADTAAGAGPSLGR
jgi:hypothetical protein